jgi:hypothetical protein
MKGLTLLLVAVAGCCACGRAEWSDGDPQLHGVVLVVEQGAESYTQDPDFKARLARIMELSAVYMGHDAGELAGLRLVVTAERFACGDTDAVGCYTREENTIRMAASSTCIENSVLPHELAHYFHGGDSGHASPEFRLPYFRALWMEIHEGSGGECERYKDVYSGQWAGPF